MVTITNPHEVESLETKPTRISVSFPPALYETLEHLARDKKVSIAWVVRDAAEKYVNDHWPLLTPNQR